MTTQPRHPLDRGTLPMPVIMELIERQNARDAHYRALFNADPGYQFVDPLPRDDMAERRAQPAHYADLHTGDMADPRHGDRPSALTVWTLLAVVAGGMAWPLLAIAVARIIQWSGQ